MENGKPTEQEMQQAQQQQPILTQMQILEQSLHLSWHQHLLKDRFIEDMHRQNTDLQRQIAGLRTLLAQYNPTIPPTVPAEPPKIAAVK